MSCCLIDIVISFQHYHFLRLLSCLMLLNTRRQSSTLFTGRTNTVGQEVQCCCIVQVQRKDLHLMGPSRKGWARHPQVPHRARLYYDVVLHRMRSASHPGRTLKVSFTGNWIPVSQVINNLRGIGVVEDYRTIFKIY